jgi:DNA-binding winged helix-turn-helix (wHTH) protein
MPLARGEGQAQDVAGRGVSGASDAAAVMVVAIAPDASDRLRLAALVSGHAPLLLVSSAQEAVEFLCRAETAADQPAAQPAVEQPRPADLTGLHLDSDRRLASWAGQSVGLSPLEHDLLRCLVASPGRTWSFARLHEEVWGNSHLGRRADVHSVVKRVRRKLRSLVSPLEIETVRGVGLRLVELADELPDDVPRRPVPVPDQPSDPSLDAIAD